MKVNFQLPLITKSKISYPIFAIAEVNRNLLVLFLDEQRALVVNNGNSSHKNFDIIPTNINSDSWIILPSGFSVTLTQE